MSRTIRKVYNLFLPLFTSFVLIFYVSCIANAQKLTGAGATFPAPLYLEIANQYKAATGISVNYQAIGSGGGITQIINRTVDFGATDAPMNNQKLQTNKLVQFPIVLGAEVVIVNIDKVVADQLNLTGDIIANIYLGKINYWNDPAIAAINPHIKLPNTSIIPVYRSDSSGTTFIFTSYLNDISSEWKTKVGRSTSVSWPKGVGARGNDGVSATVSTTIGSIGYVEYTYAKKGNLITARLSNPSGQFVAPNTSSFMEAVNGAIENVDWKELRGIAPNMININKDNAWPIVSATYVLVPRNSAAQTARVLDFFDWFFSVGDSAAIEMHYIPLPDSVKERIRLLWTSELFDSDGRAIWTKKNLH